MPEEALENDVEMPAEPAQTATETRKARSRKPPEEPAKRSTKPLLFPKPPAFKIAAENAGKAFRYWKSLPQECLDRCALYVYATWPVLNHMQILTLEEQEMVRQKKKRLSTNLAKPDKPFESDDWEDEILRRWGSGDYHFKLNDVGVKGNPEFPAKNICMWDVRRLQHPDFEPVRDIRLIDLSHPDNASYIATQRLKGVKFPGDQQEAAVQREEDNMVNATVTEKLTDALIQQTRDNVARSNAPTAPNAQAQADSKAVEAVAAGAQQGFKILGDAMQKANELSSKAADPIETIRALKEVAAILQPPPVLAKDDTALLQMMKMQHEAHMADMSNMRQELAAERTRNSALMDKLISKPESTERPRSFLQELKTLSEAKGTIAELMGLNTDAGDDTPWWGKLIERGLETLPDAANAFMHNLAVLRTGQGSPEAPPVDAEPAAEQSALEPAKPTGPDAIIINVLSQLKDPLIQALANGTPGSDFAAAIINHFKNEQVYTFLTEKGKQGMFNLLQKHGELWRETRPYAARLEVFADEFLDVERVKATLQMSTAPPQPKPNGAATERTIINPETGRPVQHTGPRVNKPS